MHRRIDVSRLPAPRVLGPSGVGMKARGFEGDLAVPADGRTGARVWVGHLLWAEATRSGAINLKGPRGHFAPVLQPARVG
jgi:hypothetical protein